MPKTLDHEKRGTHDRDDLMDIPSGIPRIIFARREVERNQCQIERDVTTAAARGGGGGRGRDRGRDTHCALCPADLASHGFFAPRRGSITFRFVFVSSWPSSSSS